MEWLNGLTLDQVVNNTDKIVKVLTDLAASKKLTLRIVFDEGMRGGDYLLAVKKIAAVPNISIMGQLSDSTSMKLYTVVQYQARAAEFLRVLGPYVAIWEVGNEINGDWLGKDVGAKALAAHKVFKAAGKKTALTGYYNCECEDKNGPMGAWIKKNIDPQLKTEIDYFFISYYEDDCEGRVVAPSEWESVFTECGVVFPTAKMGIGECGTTKAAKKITYMNRYYTMRLLNPRFIGGFFWWYGYQDTVSTNKLNATFKCVIK